MMTSSRVPRGTTRTKTLFRTIADVIGITMVGVYPSYVIGRPYKYSIPMDLPIDTSSEGRTVETPYSQYHPGTRYWIYDG